MSNIEHVKSGSWYEFSLTQGIDRADKLLDILPGYVRGHIVSEYFTEEKMEEIIKSNGYTYKIEKTKMIGYPCIEVTIKKKYHMVTVFDENKIEAIWRAVKAVLNDISI
jgi:hypothetical protein